MKSLKLEAGGRPFTNDDLATLQQEAHAAIVAPYQGCGPFIVSGCEVTGAGPTYNVAAGIVCLDGQLLRFVGAGAVTLPMQLQAGAVELSDPRPYQTGGTKNCMREVPAVLVASDPTYTSGEFLPLDSWGGKRWADVQRAAIRSMDEVQQVASLATADYDTTGLGRPGTEAWGWALANGQNGTADLRGQFIVGHNPDRAAGPQGLSTTAVGDTGGEEKHTLSVGELPRHNPVIPRVADFSSNNDGSCIVKSGDPGNGSLFALNLPTIGNSEAHENRPPFYVLAMRQWVGH